MAAWYCDETNGDDTTGDGSSGNPYQTLQKAVDEATGGDTINVANTSAQAGNISWGSGWTADNAKYTIIQAWDNGGAITIQRPDEPTAREAAQISLSGSVQAFSTSSLPTRIVLKNIIISGGSTTQLTTADYWELDGCAFTRPSTADAYSINMVGTSVQVSNVYFYDIVTTRAVVQIAGNGSTITLCFFDDIAAGGAFGDPYAFIDIANTVLYPNIVANIFKVTTAGDIAVRFKDYFTGTITANTFVSSGGAADIGILIYGINYFGTIMADQVVYNNIFYNFDGSGAKPIAFSNGPRLQRLGYNAFYDCNASDSATQIGIDNTANDITDTGDPFVDSGNNDFSVTGSAAADAGLGNP